VLAEKSQPYTQVDVRISKGAKEKKNEACRQLAPLPTT
jgi:hypothetical protein